MKFVIGLLISFAVGVGCRYFDIPVGSPAVIPGALLVVSMTIGYSSANALLIRRARPATTGHLCGGPSGAAVGSFAVGREAPELESISIIAASRKSDRTQYSGSRIIPKRGKTPTPNGKA